MSIPEACIEAARVVIGYPPEDRARRVILALAENLPESAVEKAYAVFLEGMHDPYIDTKELLRAAIIAALKDVAGETP